MLEKINDELIYVLLGSFTFLEEHRDGVYKTIIHQIDAIKSFSSVDEAEEAAENEISSQYEGYLIPQVYNGLIEIEN